MTPTMEQINPQKNIKAKNPQILFSKGVEIIEANACPDHIHMISAY